MMRLKLTLTQMKPIWTFIIFILSINARPLYGVQFDEEFTSAKHFVDKTSLLEKFFANKNRIFVTAPQGFGKTINLKMIQKFSQIEVDDEGNISPERRSATEKLFKNLKIGQLNESTITQHLAQHPVIYLDLELHIDGEITKDKIVEAFKVRLNETYFPYRGLADKNAVQTLQNSLQNEYMLLEKITKGDLEEFHIKESIRSLANLLNGYFNKSVVLLIDNYDYVVHNSFMESKGCLDMVYRFLEEILFECYHHNSKIIEYTMMTSVTSIGFQCFGLHRYLNQSSFYDNHNFSSFFGLNETEIRSITAEYNDIEFKLPIIEKYCGGYRIKNTHEIIHNTSCVIEYLQQKDNATWISQQSPSGPTKFLWKLMKVPEYLDQVSKLIKYSTVRYGRNDIISITNFTKIILEDFGETNFTSGVNSSMFSYLIQTGFLSPIESRNLFIIPNLRIRNQFMADLFYYYEKIAKIDLKSIGNRLGEFFTSERNYTGPRANLMEVLTTEFAKVKPIYGPYIRNSTNRTRCSLDYVYQSILHLAGLTNQQIQVIEDFPQPVIYEKNTGNLIKRSVTYIQKDGVNLIIKVSNIYDLVGLMLNARKYFFEQQPDIGFVVYLAIRVEPDSRVFIDVRTSPVKDEININSTYQYITSFPKKTKITKLKANKARYTTMTTSDWD